MQMTTLFPFSSTLNRRGAEGGPKRTPPNLGDAWQHIAAYEVEEVNFCLKYL